jgi:hypothetical protein
VEFGVGRRLLDRGLVLALKFLDAGEGQSKVVEGNGHPPVGAGSGVGQGLAGRHRPKSVSYVANVTGGIIMSV